MSKQPPKMSRRDWFRLRSSTAKASTPQRLGADEAPKLRSIEEPVNHGEVDLASLPPMHEAILDATEISALFSDLEHHATNVQLIARSATGPPSDHSPQLRTACDHLLAGKVRKMQVRYEWQNARWIDTFEQQPGGFRLVRIRHA
jgi:hypothetical protein